MTDYRIIPSKVTPIERIPYEDTWADWYRSPSGWWRKRGYATLSRWRTAGKPHRCNECGALIEVGEMYIVASAPPWHEFTTANRWYSHNLCRRHLDWAPPS